MSCRNDYAGLVRHVRAHERKHSNSSAEVSMRTHGVPEQVRIRQTPCLK